MFRRDVQNKGIATTPGAQPQGAVGRGEVLASFGLLFIAVILTGLAVTSFVIVLAVRQQARAQAEQAAPAIMNLIAQVVRTNLEAPADELQHTLNNLTRIPRVQYCRLELEHGVTGDPHLIEARAPHVLATTARQMRTKIQTRAGEVAGTLIVGYELTPDPAVAGMLWTATGLVAIGCLVAFWLIYRWMRQRSRPIGFVRDNLLAYHEGTERAWDLLTVQELAGREVQAWNALLASVADMQRELDAYRTRQNLSDSLLSMQSQSSQAILNALPIGILRVDSDDRIIYANYSATQLLRIHETEAERPLLTELLLQPVAETILGLRRNIAGTGIDCRLEHPSGQTIVRLIPINLGPDHNELVVTIQDITQLKEAKRTRDEFLTHITHELRTPLTNIRAYAETLNDDFFDDEQTRRECYNVIMAETRRLSKLIEDVLSVSQIEAGAARLTRVSLRLDESLRQAVQDVQATADAKSIELSLKIPSKVPTISGDRLRLLQVWTNLIGNAIKYTPESGMVSVALEFDQQVIRLRVSDSGIGIAPEYHEQVFEMFFRVPDAVVDAETGTGLGLAIVREIVRLHGGSIWVESESGSGTTFVVELPVSDSNENSEQVGLTDGTHRDR